MYLFAAEGETHARLPHDDRPRRPHRACPRRIRATLGGQTVLDTTHALYVWEWPNYPQYYIPNDDVRRELLVDEQHTQRLHRGTAHLHGLRVRDITRPSSARLYMEDAAEGLVGTACFEWEALDAPRSN